MAQIIAFLAVALAISVAPAAMAMEYMVGDDKGWSLPLVSGSNYTDWIKGKTFYVGDSLMFMYNSSNHNLLEVNSKTDFITCRASNLNTTSPLTTGNDTIKLTSSGKKWYICTRGSGRHCLDGLRLVIDVSDLPVAPTPAPTSGSPGDSAATKTSALKSCAGLIAVIAVYRMIMGA